MKTSIALLICVSLNIAIAQTDSTFTIPFASKGNTIDLTIANTWKINTQSINVSVSNAPSW